MSGLNTDVQKRHRIQFMQIPKMKRKSKPNPNAPELVHPVFPAIIREIKIITENSAKYICNVKY